MKTTYKSAILSIVAIFFAAALFAQNETEIILNSMKKEVDRNRAELKIDELRPPFYVSYTISDTRYISISGTLGSIVYSGESRNRNGFPFMLVGSYEDNNLNLNTYVPMYRPNFQRFIPLENTLKGISTGIWADLDATYKGVAETYEAKQTALKQQQIKEEDLELPDFQKVEPVNIILQRPEVKIDKAYWENFIEKSSAALKKYPELTQSQVSFGQRDVMIYYYSTDGSRYAVPTQHSSLSLNMNTMTDAGQDLSNHFSLVCATIDELPDLETFIAKCEAVVNEFLKLRNAPMVEETYFGPVLIEDRALAPIVMDQFFGGMYSNQPKLLARRVPVNKTGFNMGGSADMMFDKKIISRDLSITAMSGTQEYNGQKLMGYYPVDGEGVVPDKELVLVENGVLKNLLNGRIPTKKVSQSNGHNRFNGNMLQLMPGNVRLSSSNTYSAAQLKQKLIEAAKEEDLEYAYIIRSLAGGNTGYYRIYVEDGREELVNGANMVDFNMRAFRRILGASNEDYIYNTFAYSQLPASIIVPQALLFEEIEITGNNNIMFKQPFIAPNPLTIKN